MRQSHRLPATVAPGLLLAPLPDPRCVVLPPPPSPLLHVATQPLKGTGRRRDKIFFPTFPFSSQGARLEQRPQPPLPLVRSSHQRHVGASDIKAATAIFSPSQ
jgi:hypothetical protein